MVIVVVFVYVYVYVLVVVFINVVVCRLSSFIAFAFLTSKKHLKASKCIALCTWVPFYSAIQHFFSDRIVNKWNSLSEDIISASSLNNFKGKLLRLYNDGLCTGFFKSA